MKNTAQLVKAMLMISILLVQEFKDGKTTDDLEQILAKLKEDPIKQALIDAYNDLEKVPSEVKSAGAIDIIKLLGEVAPEFFFLVEAIRSEGVKA